MCLLVRAPLRGARVRSPTADVSWFFPAAIASLPAGFTLHWLNHCGYE